LLVSQLYFHFGKCANYRHRTDSFSTTYFLIVVYDFHCVFVKKPILKVFPLELSVFPTLSLSSNGRRNIFGRNFNEEKRTLKPTNSRGLIE